MSGPDPRPSQAIDRYRIESLLGKGGMGEVYKAFDPVLDRTVALKTISSTSDDPQLLQRLYAEARACGRLSHPNIVQVYDLHESSNAVYISMEYLEGESLSSALLPGRLSLGDKLRILDQILAALQYAHTKGVIHRDVKPSNIHVLPDGHIKLLDFGLARIAVGPTMTVAGAVMGTAPYMSPEQLKAQVVDARTDIYSTGVLAYEMFTGHRAFDGEHITAVMLKVLQETPAPIDTSGLGIPPEIAQVISCAMSKSPGDRYQSADEMRGALAACARLSPTLNGALQATAIAGPQSTAIAGPQSTAIANPQSNLTQVIPGRQSPLDSTIDEYGRAIPADPMRVLEGARSRPASDVKTTIAEASFAEQMMAWATGPRARSWVGIAVLLLAFSIVWAITQLFLSPGTSASVTPANSDVSAPVAPPPLQPPVTPPPTGPEPPSSSGQLPIDFPPSVGNDSKVPAGQPSPSRPGSQASLSPAPGAGSSQGAPSSPVGSSRQGASPGQTQTARRSLTVMTGNNNDVSKALAERVRELLRSADFPPNATLVVSLDMSTRPSPFAGTNAITADYVGSATLGRATYRVNGNVLGFGEVTLRNDVIERAAMEIVAELSGGSPAR